MKRREFTTISDNDVMDYFIKGFNLNKGKIQDYKWYYDTQKQTFIFELYVDYEEQDVKD